MIYVRDRSADSICETELEFFAMNSSYVCNHIEGKTVEFDIRDRACLYIACGMSMYEEAVQ